MLLLVDVLSIKNMFYSNIQIENNKNNKQGVCITVMQMICETLIYLKQVSDATCPPEGISLRRYPKRNFTVRTVKER